MAAFWPIGTAQIIRIISYPIRKKSRFWLFYTWSDKQWIMPSSRESHKHRERAWSQASQLIIDCAYSIAPHIISITFNSSLANGIFPRTIGSPQRLLLYSSTWQKRQHRQLSCNISYLYNSQSIWKNYLSSPLCQFYWIIVFCLRTKIQIPLCSIQ